MAQATFSVRMDETLKRQFDKLSPDSEITREKALQAFTALREQSAKNFPQGMSLEEINEEIRKTRSNEEDKW